MLDLNYFAISLSRNQAINHLLAGREALYQYSGDMDLAEDLEMLILRLQERGGTEATTELNDNPQGV